MKKHIAFLLSIVWIIVCAPNVLAAQHPFSDVPAESWYSDAVQYVYDNGLMNGTDAETFAPEETMTRAMLVTVLYRMDGSPEIDASHPFTDVSDSWYTSPVIWAYTNGIVNGTSSTTFAPEDSITREQMVTIFYRYAQYKRADTTASADLSEYHDSEKIDDYAQDAFAWAVAEGIVSGTAAATLDPDGNATRAQCAVIIQRYIAAAKPEHVHSWTDATCTAPKTCITCGATEGSALAHKWSDATCTVPKTCFRCGATEGGVLNHDYVKIYSSNHDLLGSEIILLCRKCGDLYAYTVGEVDFTVNDTLPDGNGKKVNVILLGGQSNAAGCSLDDYLKQNVPPEKYAEYDNGYDNVFINYYVSDSAESHGFVKCATRQGEPWNCFGPELGLAEKLNELYPDETFFIIKYTWSGTNLFEQWLSPSTSNDSGVLYRQFVKFAEQSILYLESKNYDVEIEGMCWMQGESDSFSVENGTDYKVHLSNFIKDIRSQFAPYAAPDGIAFIDACIADNPVYWVYCDLVNQSKQEVAKESPMNALIDTNAHGLTCNLEPVGQPDMAHYDSLSQIKLGNLFALELANYID